MVVDQSSIALAAIVLGSHFWLVMMVPAAPARYVLGVVENASGEPWLVLVAGVHTQTGIQFKPAIHVPRIFCNGLPLYCRYSTCHLRMAICRHLRTRVCRFRYELAVAHFPCSSCGSQTGIADSIVLKIPCHCQRRKFMVARILDVHRFTGVVPGSVVNGHCYFYRS